MVYSEQAITRWMSGHVRRWVTAMQLLHQRFQLGRRKACPVKNTYCTSVIGTDYEKEDAVLSSQEVLEDAVIDEHVLLTRSARKDESKSPEALAAWEKELDNFRSHRVWDDTPIERKSLSAGARIFPLLGLTSVKHAERGADEQKMKARLVGRGDIGRTANGEAAVETDELWAPVAQLSTVRMVQALGVLLGLRVESLDVTSAYLQADLRTRDEYYVIIPRQVLCYLSPKERRRHDDF